MSLASGFAFERSPHPSHPYHVGGTFLLALGDFAGLVWRRAIARQRRLFKDALSATREAALESSNLLTLCGTHHRAVHRGELLIECEHEGAFTFRHADGSAYGSPTEPRLIDAHAKVFSPLRHLGFREGEVKTVLSELRDDAELDGATVERLLREALCRIRQKSR